jgi:hypothetical protein
MSKSELAYAVEWLRQEMRAMHVQRLLEARADQAFQAFMRKVFNEETDPSR